MTGGYLNLVRSSASSKNQLLHNGTPKISFFKSKYSKYTNFGMQNFRVDYNGNKELNECSPSKFTFDIPKYGDMLLNTYVVINLPHIWSPIQPPDDGSGNWVPYEFKWIHNIGAQMIDEITIRTGSQKLQSFSGTYILSLVDRDYNNAQKELFNNMTANTPYFNDPGNNININSYPNAYYDKSNANAEPSIRGRRIYIPISSWYSFSSKNALPLISLQREVISIDITFRPVYHWFTVRDIDDIEHEHPHLAPEQTINDSNMYKFIQPPPNPELQYSDLNNKWNHDIHLITKQSFLSDDERKLFALTPQSYLIKEVRETIYNNIIGSSTINIHSNNLVSSWMFFLRRSDANERNEWSNYTNWAYSGVMPYPPRRADKINGLEPTQNTSYTPDRDPDGTNTNLTLTGPFYSQNEENILKTFTMLYDGIERETLHESSIYNYVEKFNCIGGSSHPGIYSYNFTLKTSPFIINPMGAMNNNNFNKIKFNLTTHLPEINPNSKYSVTCSGEFMTITDPKDTYLYTFDFYLIEEFYNMIIFQNGICGLKYAK